MNAKDTERWLADLSIRCPEAGKWCRANPKTVGVWTQELFGDLLLQDCCEANRLMMAEGMQVKPWEMDGFGALIRRRVKAIEAERWRVEDERARPKPKPLSKRGSMGVALTQLLDKTLSAAERRKLLDREFPDDDGPRYRCRDCWDTGLITILDPAAVIETRATGTPPRAIYTSVVACNCAAGDKYALTRDGEQAKAPRLNLAHHYPCTNGTRERLETQLAEAINVCVPPNYHREFDAWNRGE